MANGVNGIDPETTTFLPAPALSPPALPQPLEVLLGLGGGQPQGERPQDPAAQVPGLHPSAYSLVKALFGEMAGGGFPSSLGLHEHTQALYRDFPHLRMGFTRS